MMNGDKNPTKEKTANHPATTVFIFSREYVKANHEIMAVIQPNK